MFFLSQVNKVAKTIACFQHTTNSGNQNHVNDSTTLIDNMLYHSTAPKLSRKRKSIASHYNH
ncbi:uncharacterized protein RHIMIDRAFT_263769 [Rhizopus microsporus ATCC 52813]|uniref:Uncharacterized protein n=2 Tax=Rhizopus microsporus TaxID=58291 RepID=A0A2G4SJU6_RHIZD|nr:uncharacterized protein RHIMIDRAFT_263769 [Rhizopus microsporus ATCC 52813]PHZ09031.1 hypothetical protein RHIMIDRAFT_263769 [Rhizopus microsporus ATCC 52813]